MPEPALTIGMLAGRAGVHVETIRFYQRKGLLPLPPRPPQGIRTYTSACIDRVRFIKAAQAWGFSLGDIAMLLRLEDGAPCDDARRVAEGRLAVVRTHLGELRRVERVLRRAVERCRTAGGPVPCPLIAALHPEGPPGRERREHVWLGPSKPRRVSRRARRDE